MSASGCAGAGLIDAGERVRGRNVTHTSTRQLLGDELAELIADVVLGWGG